MISRFRWHGGRSLFVGVVAALVFGGVTAVGAVGQVATVSGPAAANQYTPARVTICHWTTSRRNPIVTIRVPARTLRAHRRHGDHVGACPRGRRVTICHKVRGKKRRFVTISVPRTQLWKHRRHGDRLRRCGARR